MILDMERKNITNIQVKINNNKKNSKQKVNQSNKQANKRSKRWERQVSNKTILIGTSHNSKQFT
jgi:ABC-type lipoprotein release transport system permease subunit